LLILILQNNKMTHTRKTDFERLTPSEQLAIETMAKNVKAEELISVYKEAKATETRDKYPTSAGNVLGAVILIIFILVILLVPAYILQTYMNDFKNLGPEICLAHNSTFVGVSYGTFTSINIICSEVTIKLP